METGAVPRVRPSMSYLGDRPVNALGPGPPAAVPVNPRGPVFLSYRHSDGLEVATSLAWALRAAGVPVWHDMTDLPPGDTNRRLQEALDSGLSGAVLLVTPEIEFSEVVRELELPRLRELERDPEFTLAVGTTIKRQHDPGKLDYAASDRLLRQPAATLSVLKHHSVASREDQAALANTLSRQRSVRLRADVESSSGTLNLDIQTRVPPAASILDGDLVLRLRPPADGERRPNRNGLEDVQRFLGHLPQLIQLAGAEAVRVRGGAHLSVACALGAALPTTLVGRVEAVDTRGDIWTMTGQAQPPAGGRRCECVTPPIYNSERGPVLIYVDLLPQRSDAAFDEFASRVERFAGVMHIRSCDSGLLSTHEVAAIIGELANDIRDLANTHRTTEIHLLLRCPYPIALLLGRTLNTLTVHLYEWEDQPDSDGAVRPRYVPSLVLRSGSGGSPISRVTAPPNID